MPEYYERKKQLQVKVGVMVLLAVLTLLFGYGWLRDWYFGVSYTRINVIFLNAQNLQPGDPVSIYGVRKGKIESIDLRREGVLVTLMVMLPFALPEDSRFIIKDTDLMGNKEVHIVPGKAEQVIGESATVSGENSIGFSALIESSNNTLSNMNDLFAYLTNEENGLINTINASLAEIREASSSFNNIIANSNSSIEKTIVNLHSASEQISLFLSENSDDLGDVISKTSVNLTTLQNSLNELNQVMSDIQPFIQTLRKEDSSLHKFVSDDELYEKLLNTGSQVDSLLIDIRKNPHRYFKLKLF